MKMCKYFSVTCIFFLVNILIRTDIVQPQGFNSITSSDGLNLVAVGNAGNMYRSGNSGSSWVNMANGVLNQNCVTSWNNDVWIAANSGTVYKTGKTVSPVSIYTVGSPNNLNSITFVDANTGFTCGDLGVVYKTVNGGVNWSVSNAGITGGKLNSISFRDANNGTVVGNTGYVYVTANGGMSWLVQTSGTINNLLKVKYFNDSLVVTGENGTLLLNTGSGWTSVSTRIKSDIRGVSGTNMSDVHVCGGGGFIRNNKSGSNGFLNFEKNPMMANLVDIFYFDNNKGWAVSSLNGVIIYTTNGGTSWSMPTGSTVAFNWVSKTGASGNFLGNNICPHPNNKDAVFIGFSNKVYRSNNRGENWSQIGINIPTATQPHSLFVSPLDTNLIMVATEGTGGDRVYRTTNYGTSWDQVLSLSARSFSNYGQPLEIDQNNPSVFYFAPDGGGFYKSTDNGATFIEISGNYPFRSPCEILVTWDNSNVIILGDGVTSASEPAKMFRSTNGGVNWTKIDSAASSETPSMCNTVFDNSIVWCTEWSGSNVYKSTNMGANFSLHHNTGFSGWGSDISREDPTMIITGGWSNYATLSTDGGQSWMEIRSGLTGHGGGILAAERGFVLAQQGSNIYKLNITYTNTTASDTIDVQALSLGATGTNYFTSTTIIPSGTVKNNNGLSPATFNVTRKINPGGYLSTKIVTNLIAGTSTSVNFDPWTFTSGTVYAVKDSVYLSGDLKPFNDVLTGSITPYLGETVFLVNESFAGIFPPPDWSFIYTSANYWIYNTASAYGSGKGSAEYNYFDSPAGTIQSLITNTSSTPSSAGDSLTYDYAYRPDNNGSTDSLIIETSTDGGSSYSALVRLYGRNTGSGIYSLNTGTSTGSEFTPTAGQWLNKKWGLPAGTNKIKFKAVSGFGNNLYLDNIIVSSNILFTQANIELVPQGLYNGATSNKRDTVKAYLRYNISPFNSIDSATSVIDSVTLNSSFVFENAPSGTYYIQIVHRNAIETWSEMGGEAFTRGVTFNYNFTSLQSQAYGNNQVLVGSKWCMYSGDIDRNGSINLTDIISVFNDATSFTNGYVITDLNGDNVVTLNDIIIVFNNANNFVTKKTPELSMTDMNTLIEKNRRELKEYKKKTIGITTDDNSVELKKKLSR